MQSYPLIGLDKDRNEHSFEFLGASPRDAAQKGGEKLGYIEVLSGDQSSRRNGKANGIYYKQTLFRCKTHAEIMGKLGPTSLALSMAEKLNKSGPALVQDLRARGLVPSVQKDEETGEPILHIGLGTLTAPLTSDTKEQLRVEVEANEKRIIKALLEEVAKKEPKDPYKGQGRAEVVRKILPQMPMRFTFNDFLTRLKAAEYIDFASDKIAVRNGLTHALQCGDMVRIKTGLYAVAERLRVRKQTSPESPAPAVYVSPANIPVQNMQELKAPPLAEPIIREVSVAEAPLPPPADAKPVEPISEDHPAKDQTISTQVIPTGMFETLLCLATQAIATPDDGEDLAQQMEEAKKAFENAMLEAVSAFTTTVTRGAERIRSESQARKNVRQLTRVVTERAAQVS